MPDSEDGLEQVAADYYGCNKDAVLAMPGSQYALQNLPQVIPPGRVAISVRGYSEHAVAWRRFGHTVVYYSTQTELEQLVFNNEVDHVIVINPNNPTCAVYDKSFLLTLHKHINEKGGLLILDEAFTDTMPELSLAPMCPLDGLVILCSVGKFFGLAGIRLGFVLAPEDIRKGLIEHLPPWHLAHPARWVGSLALADTEWQEMQRKRLNETSADWKKQLQAILPELEFQSLPLFASGTGSADFCENLYQALGRRGILIRLFDNVDNQRIVRIGLPLPGEENSLINTVEEAAEECRTTESIGS